MSFAELILIAVGLAADAFAASVCKGLSLHRVRDRDITAVGLWFGGFQALMPTIGCLLGRTFSQFFAAFDHWAAFILLGTIGLKMLLGSSEGEADNDPSLTISSMLPLAVATSVDALAVGVTFAFLEVDLLPAVSVIGLVTFLLSATGVKIGAVIGDRCRTAASRTGGAVLVGMGIKILIEHLIMV